MTCDASWMEPKAGGSVPLYSFCPHCSRWKHEAHGKCRSNGGGGWRMAGGQLCKMQTSVKMLSAGSFHTQSRLPRPRPFRSRIELCWSARCPGWTPAVFCSFRPRWTLATRVQRIMLVGGPALTSSHHAPLSVLSPLRLEPRSPLRRPQDSETIDRPDSPVILLSDHHLGFKRP